MSSIQTSVVVPVSSHQAARNRIVSSLPTLAAKLDSDTGLVMALKRGSQTKMRILGGAFIGDKDLPVLAQISFNDAKPSEVTVIVSEHMVVGITLGIRDKYQRACTLFAQEIANAIKDV